MTQFEAIRSVNSEKGSALVLALLAMLIVSMLGLSLLARSMTEVTIESNWKDYSGAFYGAEAGLESGLAGLKPLLQQVPNPTAADLATITPPTLSNPQLSFTTFQIQPTGPTYQTLLGGSGFKDLQAFVTDYQINAQVSEAGGSKATLTQVLQRASIPLFQFGAFYGKGVDLEVSIGEAPLTFAGPVHANSNVYLRVFASGALKFDSTLTTSGNIYRYVKRDPESRQNGPLIKDANGVYQELDFDHEYEPGFDDPWSEAEWAATAESTYGGMVRDSAMGIAEIIPPIPELFQDPANPDVVAHQLIEKGTAGDSAEMQAAKVYYKADVRIEDGVAYKGNGTPINMAPCNSDTITSKTFYDAREQKTMTVTEVDIQLLTDCGKAPANGILYVANSSPNGAVRLVKGVELPSQGLSVVSENPVYVMGDYNSVNKVPAAVMGDAITVLSANWDDTKGAGALSARGATDTTVNAAFATGPSAESVEGQGNGQLENLIRFLEDWSDKTVNYSGSLIALWHSQQATAPWSYGSYYRAPIRNWTFDPDLVTNPPPGAPAGTVLTKGRWSQS